ncbi:MAG: hypothetical protein AAGF11_13215 [Myxococcota bacterium]
MAKRRLGTITLTIVEWLGVIFFALIGIIVTIVVVMLSCVGDPPDPMGNGEPPAVSEGSKPIVVAAFDRELPAASAEERGSLFAPVYDVLVSPRCMNCHPDGDRPLSDRFGVHAMNISRQSFEAGMLCNTCHAEKNTELPGSPLGPPGAPHWQLPPKETPMVFENRTITALCKQLRDPADNGGRKLADLLEHVNHDPLVLWGWNPGGNRATPAVSHEAFVKSFGAWVDAGGICPGESVAPDLTGEAESDAPEEEAKAIGA